MKKKSIWSRYFDYFLDERDILPKSVTPYRGVASTLLGILYLLILAPIYLYSEALGWIYFIVMMGPILIHLFFGMINLVIFDAQDIYLDFIAFLKK